MKKRITCVLAMTVALALLIGSVGVLPALGEYSEPIRGDVNFDAEINAQDAGFVLLYLVGKQNSSWYIEPMDADLDGEINAMDATRILLYCVGKKELPPLPKEPDDFEDNTLWLEVVDRDDLLDYYTVELFSEYGVIDVEYSGWGWFVLTLDVHDKDNVLRVVEQIQERDDVLSANPCYYEHPAEE